MHLRKAPPTSCPKSCFSEPSVWCGYTPQQVYSSSFKYPGETMASEVILFLLLYHFSEVLTLQFFRISLKLQRNHFWVFILFCFVLASLVDWVGACSHLTQSRRKTPLIKKKLIIWRKNFLCCSLMSTSMILWQ